MIEPEKIFDQLDYALKMLEQKKIDLIFQKFDPDPKDRIQIVNITQKLRTKFELSDSELLRDILGQFASLSNQKQIDRVTFHAILRSKHTRAAFNVQQLIDDEDIKQLKKKVEDEKIAYIKHFEAKQRQEKMRQRFDQEIEFQKSDNLTEALLKYRDTEEFTRKLYRNILVQDRHRTPNPKPTKSREKENQYRHIQRSMRGSQQSLSPMASHRL